MVNIQQIIIIIVIINIMPRLPITVPFPTHEPAYPSQASHPPCHPLPGQFLTGLGCPPRTPFTTQPLGFEQLHFAGFVREIKGPQHCWSPVLSYSILGGGVFCGVYWPDWVWSWLLPAWPWPPCLFMMSRQFDIPGLWWLLNKAFRASFLPGLVNL